MSNRLLAIELGERDLIFWVADIEIGDRTIRIAAGNTGFGDREVGILEIDIGSGEAGFDCTGSDLRLPEL